MKDITEKLADIHELIVDQVFEDLQNGDRKARQEAMMLLKQNNVTATAENFRNALNRWTGVDRPKHFAKARAVYQKNFDMKIIAKSMIDYIFEVQ